MYFYDESDITNPYIEVKMRDGKYALVHKSTGEDILPDYYDNLYIRPGNLFILCKSGKFGAVLFPNNCSDAYLWCAAIEYDCFEMLFGYSIALCGRKENVLILCNKKTEIIYCTHYYLISDNFLSIEDETSTFILNIDSGERIFKEQKDNSFFIGAPCYGLLTETEDEPLFFDYTYGEYIIPSIGRIR